MSSSSPQAAFQDRPGLSPPWQLGGVGPGLFRIAPWLRPSHPRFSGSQPVLSLGVEWCGLRVGYPADVEPAFQAIEESAWWGHLREVPSAPVALRGEREGFLFYDGATDMPSPLQPSWEDESKRFLCLRVENWASYPDPGWLHRPERDLNVESPKASPVPAAFVIERHEGASARGAILRWLAPREEPFVVRLDALGLEGDSLVGAMRGELRLQGLAEVEAESLIRTWTLAFFEKPGLRLVTFLPRWLYDTVVPITIRPRPATLVRVALVLREI